MVCKKITIFMQQSCGTVLCQILVCPFESKSYKFVFSSERSKYFFNLYICSKIKTGSALASYFLFFLIREVYVPGHLLVDPHQLRCN